MADLIGTAHQGATSSGQGSARAKFDEAAASTKSLGEQAMSAGRDLTDKAKDIAESSTDKIKGQASDLVDAAKDVASQATDKIKDAVNDRKRPAPNMSAAWRIPCGARRGSSIRISRSRAPTSEKPPPRSRAFRTKFATAI